jgi:hypothetical protein
LEIGLYTDMPIVGGVFGWWIHDYLHYYITQWDINPPATSSSTVEVPACPDPYTLPAHLTQDWMSLYNLLYGEVSSVYGLVEEVKGVADLILDRLPGGATPPIVASTDDQARLLAAIYYVSKQILTQPANVDDTAILDAIDAAETSVNGGVDGVQTSVNTLHSAMTGRFDTVDETLSGLGTTISGWVDAAVVAINAVTNGIESTIAGLISGAVEDILAALPGGGGTAGAPVWPGLSGVTLSTPVSITAPTVITETMDGILFAVVTTPPGQSIQPASSHTRYKGLAWCAFLSDNGEAEPKEPLEIGDGVLCPRHMLHAAAVVVYCKPGANIQVTPWVITP